MKYARWITDGEYIQGTAINPAPFTFIKEFEAGDNLVSASLDITSMGIYTVLLNGKRVEEHYFAPYFTDFKKTLQVQTYDINPFLKQKNTIEIVVGAGWTAGRYGELIRTCRYEKKPALLAELTVTYLDGTVMTVPTDNSWKVSSEGHYRFADWCDGEIYDATVDYESVEWHNAVFAHLHSKPRLVPQYGEYVKVISELEPVSIIEKDNGEIIFDFGQNTAGVISAEINAKEGQIITFRHAEMLFGTDLFTLPLRTAQNTVTYRAKDGEQTYSPRLTYMGFRYVSVSGIAPSDIRIKALVLSSDCKENGSFQCSNEKLNRLFQTVKWTARSNMIDVPTESPSKDERMARPSNMTLFAPTMTFLFHSEKFIEKWLKDLTSNQYPGGLLPAAIPVGKSVRSAEIAFGDSAVTVPWAEYLAYGNLEVLREQYPSVCRFIKGAMHSCRFLSLGYARYIWVLPSHPGDWATNGESKIQWRSKGSLIATAYLANSCQIAAKMAELLGFEKDAQKYHLYFENICSAFARRFIKDKGKLKEESQIGYALPLCFHLVSPETAKYMAKNLFTLISEDNHNIVAGYPGAHLVLFALADNGYAEEAYRMLLQEDMPSWLYGLKKGATTLWECFDAITPAGNINLYPGKRHPFNPTEINRAILLGQSGGNLSFNHIGFTAVTEFLYKRVAGLESLEGGYKKVLVHPVPGSSVKNASASVDTPYGKLSVDWKIEHAFMIMKLELPEGTSAHVILPDGTEQDVDAGSHNFKTLVPWRRYKITENENKDVVESIREGLRRKNGFCPCRTERTEDNKCICAEFRSQLQNPDFEGYCHCMLYKKTYEDIDGGING